MVFKKVVCVRLVSPFLTPYVTVKYLTVIGDKKCKYFKIEDMLFVHLVIAISKTTMS